MLIPRYSIRWLLGLMTFSAGVSLVLSYAVRGHAWAIGVTSMLWTFVVLAIFYVSAFLCAWLIDQALVTRARRSQKSGSPFAAATPGGIPLGNIPVGAIPLDSIPIGTAAQQPPADSPPAMTG